MLPSVVTIRPAIAGDLPAVAALWAVAGGPTRSDSSLVGAQRLHGRDPEALLVADLDGAVIGTLIVGWDGWRCHLYRLAVLPEHRRQGIAGRLLDGARERARAVGAERIDAMVTDANGGGVAFWRASGFELDTDDHRWSSRLR